MVRASLFLHRELAYNLSMTNASETPIALPVGAADPTSPPWSWNTRRIVAAIFLIGVALAIWKFQGLLAQVIIAWLVAYLLNPVINALIRGILRRAVTDLFMRISFRRCRESVVKVANFQICVQ